MIIIVAFGTSTPTSITVVETKTSMPSLALGPALNRRMMSSFSSLDIRPCKTPTLTSFNGPPESIGATSNTASGGRFSSSVSKSASSSAAAPPMRGATI